MTANIKQAILESIEKIHIKSEKCKLDTAVFKELENELKIISSYLKTSELQALLTSLIFSLGYKMPSVDLNSLADHLDCNPMKLLYYSDDFNELIKKRIIEKESNDFPKHLEIPRDQYVVNEKISEAILNNDPMPKLGPSAFNDIFDFLNAIHDLGRKRDDEAITSFMMLGMAEEMIKANLHLPFVKRVHQINLEIIDTFIYLYLIWETLMGNESCDLRRMLEDLFDHNPAKVKYMQDVINGGNILIKNSLIETSEASFIGDAEIRLTDKSIDILSEHKMKLFNKRIKKNNVIYPDEIVFKKLLFDDRDMKQLHVLKKLLLEENLGKTRERLMSRGLPMGINVMLHGFPGTGKTETALQLAKYTGREIMKVEISKSKSMWFGESEKLIKKIFTDYKSYARNCEKIPILLFNEADALFSRRQQTGSSNTAQTENAIQNILLEELENFDGILIATTNLTGNLDTAFERRFLFKIEFEKPSSPIKARIWKSKMPWLTEEESQVLGAKFDFSGGQIENVVRKSEIHEIIHGIKVNLADLTDFCREEILERTKTKIGFNLS